MQRRRPNTTMYLPAFRRSRAHTRATRSGTPPSSRPSADIVNREYVLSRLIALRRPAAVCAACSGHANTSGSPREDLSRFLVSTLLARCFELRPIYPAAFEFSLYRTRPTLGSQQDRTILASVRTSVSTATRVSEHHVALAKVVSRRRWRRISTEIEIEISVSARTVWLNSR